MINKPTSVWIDTDPGNDDMMAILLLAQNSLVNILGVSTVFGNTSLPKVTRNAKFILDLAKRNDIPLFAGAEQPLIRDQICADIHGESGLDGVTLVEEDLMVADKAQEAIIKALEDAEEPITILALGPLTNIAKLFTTRPDLISRVQRLVIMGGAITVPGNKNRVAEFNVFCDPEAAESVFNTIIPKTLIPLDPCTSVVLTDRDIASLPNRTVGTTLKRILKPYIENICIFEGVQGALMYDPIAAYYLLNPAAFTTVPMDVRVETSSKGLTYGMTVAERRIIAERVFNMDVVTEVDAKQFISAFLAAIKEMDKCDE
ncbi:TPA: nucleoside hydrolase [Candidatus Uhrbacteria bacterium]|nr:nucleoside hydrolase [Candidatus Uhrbacteria bacterium]